MVADTGYPTTKFRAYWDRRRIRRRSPSASTKVDSPFRQGESRTGLGWVAYQNRNVVEHRFSLAVTTQRMLRLT